MLTKIEFHGDYARVFFEMDVERSGVIPRPRSKSHFPTVEKVLALMPALVRELAPGFMDQEVERDSKFTDPLILQPGDAGWISHSLETMTADGTWVKVGEPQT